MSVLKLVSSWSFTVVNIHTASWNAVEERNKDLQDCLLRNIAKVRFSRIIQTDKWMRISEYL